MSDSPFAIDDGYLEAQYERWMECVDEVMPHVYRVFRDRGMEVDPVQAKEVIEIAHEADDPEWSYNYDRMIDELFRAVSSSAGLLQDWEYVYDTLDEYFPLRMP